MNLVIWQVTPPFLPIIAMLILILIFMNMVIWQVTPSTQPPEARLTAVTTSPAQHPRVRSLVTEGLTTRPAARSILPKGMSFHANDRIKFMLFLIGHSTCAGSKQNGTERREEGAALWEKEEGKERKEDKTFHVKLLFGKGKSRPWASKNNNGNPETKSTWSCLFFSQLLKLLHSVCVCVNVCVFACVCVCVCVSVFAICSFEWVDVWVWC